MRLNKTHILLLILAAAATLYLFLPSDEKKIRNNLSSLAEYCSSSPEDAPLAVLKNGALAAKRCSDPCSVEIESLSIEHSFTRKELTDHILLMKKTLGNTTFTFHDTVVEFPEENRADLLSTLRLKGGMEDNRFTDAYEFNISAKKIEGEWLFSSFTVVEFVEQ